MFTCIIKGEIPLCSEFSRTSWSLQAIFTDCKPQYLTAFISQMFVHAVVLSIRSGVTEAFLLADFSAPASGLVWSFSTICSSNPILTPLLSWKELALHPSPLFCDPRSRSSRQSFKYFALTLVLHLWRLAYPWRNWVSFHIQMALTGIQSWRCKLTMLL